MKYGASIWKIYKAKLLLEKDRGHYCSEHGFCNLPKHTFTKMTEALKWSLVVDSKVSQNVLKIIKIKQDCPITDILGCKVFINVCVKWFRNIWPTINGKMTVKIKLDKTLVNGTDVDAPSWKFKKQRIF